MPIYVRTISPTSIQIFLCCYWSGSTKPYYTALNKHGGKHQEHLILETDPPMDSYMAVFESQEQADAFKQEMALAGWRT